MGTRPVQGWYMAEYGAVQSIYFLVLDVWYRERLV